MQKPIVIKIGGNQIDDPDFLTELAPVIRSLDAPAIIVHGGGKEITKLQEQLGLQPRYLDGVRITDEETLSVVEMVLCGLVNKRLVRYLLAGGVDALGMSGVDLGIVRAEQMQHPTEDMGFTGSVVQVRGDKLLTLLEQGITPVIAPICLGESSSYNVNADHVAGALAKAVKASQVVFLTNVEGVLVDGNPVTNLTHQQTQALIDTGAIFGGMIPKVKTALHALNWDVQQTVITNLNGLKTQRGTTFMYDGAAS